MKNLLFNQCRWLLLPLMLIFLGVGNAWGATIFQEGFGDNGNKTTAYRSATCFTATAAMFTTGSASSNYSGSGSVGKGNYSSPNYSSGYTGATGKSGCYHTGTADETSTIIQISNIKITGYSDLHLSFGVLGGSNSHRINVYYKIDSGSKTQIISNGSLSSSSWSLKEADISGSGTNLTLYFEHTPSRAWTIRLDDITVTGTTAAVTYTVSYAAGGASGTVPTSHTGVSSGSNITLKSPDNLTAPAGKTFGGWNDGSTTYAAGTSYTVTGNKTMTAVWNCITPTISVDPSNGSAVQGSSPTPLTVTASGGSLSYQWKQCATSGGTYVNVTGGSGATTSSYTPPTSSVGTMYYKCEVTNTGSSCNTTATSNYASFEVTAPTPATITLVNYDGDATTTGYYSGGSFTLPSENDFVCGDLTFVGWSSVTIDNSATKPSAATYHEPGESVTLGASNTFYAVFAEASGGGGAATYTKVTTISAGTYLMATETATEYTPTSTLAYTGDNGSGKRGGVVTISISDGVISTKPATALEITVTLGTGDDAGYFAMYDGSKYITQGAKNEFAFVDDISYQWDLNANGQIHQKGTFDSSNDNRIYVDHGNSGSQTNLFKPMKVRTEGNNSGSYFYHAYLFKKSSTISYSNYTTNCVNMRTVYLDAYHFGDTDGAKFAIYSWKNGSDPLDDKLADAFMTKVTDCYYGHLYEGEMPDNHDRVIFLRNASAAASPVKEGANKLNQTVDITTEANKDFFTIASGGAGNAYTGSWGVYTPNYAVTFDKNGVSSTSTWPSDQCIAEGGKVTDPNVTPLAMGKTFVGWYQEAEGTNAWVFNTNTVSAATTIYAKWNDVATKTIYLDASATLDGGKTWDADNTVLFVRAYINGTSLATDIKAISPISSCQPHVYAFTIPGNATHVSFARCATGTTELPASWTNPLVYNQIAGKTVESGKDHYVIDGWGSATLQNSAFAPTSYTMSFAAGDYGSGDAPANDSKACGVTYVLPSGQVFTRNGYTMDGWSINANGSTKDYNLGDSYTTDANQTFYPHWALASYGVTLNTNGGTINAGNVTTYTYGTGATLPTDVTKSHATFQGWYAASNFSGDRVYTIGTTEYGDKEYWAKWETITWTVTWKVKGETVRTDASVTDGDKVASLPSAPSDLTTGSDGCDAEFVGWVIEANDPGALSISTQETPPSGIFTNVAGSPAITANTTFVAIYRQEQ